MPTAILVDGSFFLKRYQRLRGDASPEKTAKELHEYALMHLVDRVGQRRELYRIFFYDCPPLTKKVHHPLTGKALDLSKTATAVFRLQFHEELKKLRKVALRLGYLDQRNAKWTLAPDKLKALLTEKISIQALTESSVLYEARQKAVDMKIGLDIASMAFKKQVDQIVLVAGDSDFGARQRLAQNPHTSTPTQNLMAREHDSY